MHAYTLKLLNEIRPIVSHLRELGQFIGFSGSLGPSQSTMRTFSYCAVFSGSMLPLDGFSLSDLTLMRTFSAESESSELDCENGV